jgi:hypothetical protein
LNISPPQTKLRLIKTIGRLLASTVGALTLGLCVCRVPADPVITAVVNTPNAPTAIDSVWVTAPVTGKAAVTNVTLTYSIGTGDANRTNTVFSETMATASAKPWTGNGCDNAWTLVYGGNKSPFEQSASANYGSGNAGWPFSSMPAAASSPARWNCRRPTMAGSFTTTTCNRGNWPAIW